MTPAPEPAPEVVEVDARGERCPLPVLRLARALGATPAPAAVRLLATDPAARTDVPALCRLRGLRLLEVVEEAAHTAYLVAGPGPTGEPAALRPTEPAAGPPGRR